MVSPGKPTPFPMISMKPDLEHGISYGLANNAWGEAPSGLIPLLQTACLKTCPLGNAYRIAICRNQLSSVAAL